MFKPRPSMAITMEALRHHDAILRSDERRPDESNRKRVYDTKESLSILAATKVFAHVVSDCLQGLATTKTTNALSAIGLYNEPNETRTKHRTYETAAFSVSVRRRGLRNEGLQAAPGSLPKPTTFTNNKLRAPSADTFYEHAKHNRANTATRRLMSTRSHTYQQKTEPRRHTGQSQAAPKAAFSRRHASYEQRAWSSKYSYN